MVCFAVLAIAGCGEENLEGEFRANPIRAYEVAESCTGGPDSPTTEHALRWPEECVIAYEVAESVYDIEYYEAHQDEAFERSIECRVSESLRTGYLYSPCKAAVSAVLERYTVDYFLDDPEATTKQIALCQEPDRGLKYLEYLPELCVRAGEAKYGITIVPEPFWFGSASGVDEHAKKVRRALEWAPVRAAREANP